MTNGKQALTVFLTDLFQEGEVVVEGQLKPFLEADVATAGRLLKRIYEEECVDNDNVSILRT